MIKYLLIILFSVQLLFACASPPPEKKPFWIEQANTSLSNGITHYERQQYELAKLDFQNALNAFQRYYDVNGIVQTGLNLAKTHISLGNIENAEKQIDVLRKMIPEYRLQDINVYVDIMQSSIEINKNNIEQALAILNTYLPKIESFDNSIKAAVLINRTRIAFIQKDQIAQWINKLESTASDVVTKARLLRFKGQLAYFNNQKEQASVFYQKALDEYRALAHSKAIYSTLKDWGNALIAINDYENAAKQHEAALTVALSANIKSDVLTILNSLSGVYEKLNNPERKKEIDEQIMLNSN